MAQTLKGEGVYIDLPYVVQTGVTITAGAMVWADISGTDVIHPLTSVRATALAESSGFIGCIAKTTTGATTGVTIRTQGVMLMDTAVESGVCRFGEPVWAISPWVVAARQTDNTGTTFTGNNPVGICVGFPNAVDTTAASVNVFVKIMPFRKLKKLTTVAGPE